MTHKGWHSRGYLPHFDARGLVQHVVLRTKDAVDLAALQRLSDLPPDEKRRQVDALLDTSQAGRLFQDPIYATALESQLVYFDGFRYDLLAWCIMPNHAHIVMCCHGDTSLGQIVRTWKVQTVRSIAAVIQANVDVFARDYFDRFMRDGHQTLRAMAYVEQNPVAAGLCNTPQDWRFSSAWHRERGWSPRTENLPVTIGPGVN